MNEEEEILKTINELGMKGHLILLEAMAEAWKNAGNEKMNDAEGFDPEVTEAVDIITSMYQVTSITEVSLALNAAVGAMQRYELADNVLRQVGTEHCGHPECRALHKARNNAENN